jgi:hypothetical protein
LRKITWRCLEGVEPQNPLQTWAPHPPRRDGRHYEFDLDLKWEQRYPTKIKKGKPVHGVMICDVVPRKNTMHAIPIF